MYLRTTKRTNKDGSFVEYFQPAHNERHPETRKPVAKIIHNFGRVDQLDRQELVRLCQSIARVCRIQVKDPLVETTVPFPAITIGLPTDLKIKQTLALGCPMVIKIIDDKATKAGGSHGRDRLRFVDTRQILSLGAKPQHVWVSGDL